MVTNTLLALSSLIWGIHNQGEPQRISIDHFTSGYVMGIKGEDIHPAPVVSGLKKTIVAVIDTGIDSKHPALKDLVDPYGFNFVSNNADTSDLHGHGTHIAGIIATQATNHALILPLKVVQTGPNAPIRPQETAPGAGTALTENVAKAVVYAIQNGAKVINLSMAWPAAIRSKAVDEAMELAIQKEVIVVASAANDSTSANLYPCIYSNVICVGAHGPDGAFTYFSNHGTMVDLLAPGIAILSTWPMSKAPVTFAGQIGYEFRNGTSMAAPFVSGAAAELLARGFTAQETVSRLLIGTRPVRSASLYQTSVVGTFTRDIKKETRTSRFGNLDISRSLEVSPQSLLVPVQKSRIELSWNGESTSVIAAIKWINRWKSARSATIRIGSERFDFDAVDENQILSTPVTIKLNTNTESTFNLNAMIDTVELNGTRIHRELPLSFEVVRLIEPAHLPKTAVRIPLQGIDLKPGSSLRSVVTTDASNDLEYLVLQGKTITLLRHGTRIGQNTIDALISENILNLYRLDESNYALLTLRNVAGSRGVFVMRTLNSKLEVKISHELGTDITVLNENLIWKKVNGNYTPIWLSLGYTPEKDKPAFDPWNPNQPDLKMPRIYFTEAGIIRTIPLGRDEVPVKLLPNGEILIASGTGYLAEYFTLEIDLDSASKIKSRKPLLLDAYRMLLGLDSSVSEIDLLTGKTNGTVFTGTSTPGNLRSTLVPYSSSTEVARDRIFQRESTLDSLVQLVGAFRNRNESSFFTQSHYDLKFYRSNSDLSQSLSLNRYSYIPSMIFNRNFFPTVAQTSIGNKVPAIYIPASLANQEISEIIIGNPTDGSISKPASLHLKATNGCSAIGNLISATIDHPAMQVFICNDSLVLIPLQIENQ